MNESMYLLGKNGDFPASHDFFGGVLFDMCAVSKNYNKYYTSWWLNQPLLKNMIVQNGFESSPNRDEKKALLKPPPRFEDVFPIHNADFPYVNC